MLVRRPGLLKQFVDDLHSGRLHREFHHGPDSTKATSTESVITSTSVGQVADVGIQSVVGHELREEWECCDLVDRDECDW